MSWAGRHLGLIGYTILTAAVAAAFLAVGLNNRKIEDARRERVAQLNAVNEAQCDALRNLYAVIAKTVRDNDAAIDTFEYYRSHPEEAAAAHRRNLETLEKFKTPACPPDIKLDH